MSAMFYVKHAWHSVDENYIYLKTMCIFLKAQTTLFKQSELFN